MLLRLFIVISVIAAVVQALSGTIWLLPVYLILDFVACIVAALVFLMVACAVVDKKKEQLHDSPFYRCLAHLYIDLVVTLGRIHIHTEGLEKKPVQGRFLLVCNHLNEIDPGVILKCFPKSQLAFVSKKENDDMPVVGAVMHKLMCQLLNRENDREALQTIRKCIRLIQEDEVSIAVFPEGGIHGDGKLHVLKGGVFKIAQRTHVPIVVCTLRDTKEALHKLLKLQPSHVTLHLVGVIQPEAYAGITTVELARRVHGMMAADLGPELVAES